MGTKHHDAKLNPEKVREVRRLSKEGVSMLDLAEKFGVTSRCIWGVVTGKTWKQVPLD